MLYMYRPDDWFIFYLIYIRHILYIYSHLYIYCGCVMMQLYIVFHFVLYFRQPSVRVFLHVILEILLLLLYSVAIRRSISFFSVWFTDKSENV